MKYKTKLLQVPEEDAARSIGDAFGYGAMMRALEAVWSDKDDKGALVVGPCLSAVGVLVAVGSLSMSSRLKIAKR
jgi:hypothetical protein